jgi:hypothetical protein
MKSPPYSEKAAKCFAEYDYQQRVDMVKTLYDSGLSYGNISDIVGVSVYHIIPYMPHKHIEPEPEPKTDYETYAMQYRYIVNRGRNKWHEK